MYVSPTQPHWEEPVTIMRKSYEHPINPMRCFCMVLLNWFGKLLTVKKRVSNPLSLCEVAYYLGIKSSRAKVANNCEKIPKFHHLHDELLQPQARTSEHSQV